jgi:integrase
MRHHRPLHHPLESLFARSAQSLTTALSDGTRRVYQGAFRSFLLYLAAHHPQVSRLPQLQRDPHILGWLAALRSHTPPFAKITIIIRVTYLHRMLQDLAWNHQIPPLAHLLCRADVPRRDEFSPRPLLPEQDQLIQQELQHRDDFLSNLLLLQRHTGMRIGECVDLTLDCLFPLAPDRWAIHVPLGKLKTERWVPVDSAVRQIVDRLRALRPPNVSTSDSFLLPRDRARETLIRRVRAAFRAVVSAAGITVRLVPHQNRHTYATEMLSLWRKLPRGDAVTRSHQPGNDPALSENHSARLTARVPPGAFSSAPPCSIPTGIAAVFLRTSRSAHHATCG